MIISRYLGKEVLQAAMVVTMVLMLALLSQQVVRYLAIEVNANPVVTSFLNYLPPIRWSRIKTSMQVSIDIDIDIVILLTSCANLCCCE